MNQTIGVSRARGKQIHKQIHNTHTVLDVGGDGVVAAPVALSLAGLVDGRTIAGLLGAGLNLAGSRTCRRERE